MPQVGHERDKVIQRHTQNEWEVRIFAELELLIKYVYFQYWRLLSQCLNVHIPLH